MIQSELVKEGVKAAPPVVITVSTWGGLALQDWVYIITFIYTLTLLLRSLPKTTACIKCFWKYRACDRRCKL